MLRRITYSDARSQIAAEIRMRRRLIISNARAQTEDENPVIPVTEKTRSTSNSSIDSHSRLKELQDFKTSRFMMVSLMIFIRTHVMQEVY